MKTEVTKHEGKILLDYVRQNGISKKEICDKLNLTVPMFAYHCRKEAFSGRFKEKLYHAEILIFEEQSTGAGTSVEYIKELEEEVKLLTQVIAIQKQFITHVTTNCKHGHCLNFILENRKS